MTEKKEGWDAIEEMKDRHIEIANKIDQLVCAVFCTNEGKELMKLLTDQFLYAPVASPADGAGIAYWREGQNNIIRRFLNAINKRQQQTPPITETINKPGEIKK